MSPRTYCAQGIDKILHKEGLPCCIRNKPVLWRTLVNIKGCARFKFNMTCDQKNVENIDFIRGNIKCNGEVFTHEHKFLINFKDVDQYQ